MKVRTKYGFQQHTNYNGRNHKTRNQTLSCSAATWRAETMHHEPRASPEVNDLARNEMDGLV